METTKPPCPNQRPIRAALATLGAISHRIVRSPRLPLVVITAATALGATACFSCGPLAPPEMPSAREHG